MIGSSGWQAHRLDELGFVGRGRSRHRPRNDPRLYGSPYPFVQTGDIKAANLHIREFEQTYNQDGLAQSKMWKPGTLCITIAANIAETAILAIPACFPDSVIGFVEDPQRSDPAFIKYYIDFIKLKMQQVSHGTTQDNLSMEKLLRFQLLVPHVQEQRKIASILQAYDDLIENNLRRIKILEEMAQSLYREWFVKFRFPGHEKVHMVDGPLGKIPEGWEVQRLEELCSAVLDGDWIETKDQGGKDYRLLQISNIGLGDFVETGKFRYVTQESFDRLRCTEIQTDDLLVARMPSPIGRGWLARKMPWRMITAVDVAIARPDNRRINPVFLLHFWNQPSTLAAVEKQSSGTTRLRITRRELCAMPIPTPPLDLQEQFSAKARPMWHLSNILRDKNNTLSRTRDLLLPKLISGELDVSELDIKIPEEAA